MTDVGEQDVVTMLQTSRGELNERLGVVFLEATPERVVATMPVEGNRQPYGLLHGGASVALAETVGSVAANLCVDMTTHMCLGQEINANHLRGISSGLVTATARPFHIGMRSQVWHIEIRDEHDRLVCVSRLTMAVVRRNREPEA